MPTLLSPNSNEILDNGCSNSSDRIIWDFDWTDCPGATQYHLYVIGNNSTVPLIDNSNLINSSYQYNSNVGDYVADANRFGWRWKVRSMVNGVWGPWSNERTFNVEPVNTDCIQNLIPLLISPSEGASLDNGCSNGTDRIIWDFDWTDVPGASFYHLYVIGNNSTVPLIDNSNLINSSYQYNSNVGDYVADANRFGWRWKVRLMVNGVWGPWSNERTFNVEPVNTDCAQCNVTGSWQSTDKPYISMSLNQVGNSLTGSWINSHTGCAYSGLGNFDMTTNRINITFTTNMNSTYCCRSFSYNGIGLNCNDLSLDWTNNCNFRGSRQY